MLTGQQIFLRKMEIEDTDDIVRWRNSEEVRSRFLYQEPFTREKHLDWIENKIKHTYIRMNERYRNCHFQYQGWVR